MSTASSPTSATLIPFPLRGSAPSLENHRARVRHQQQRLMDAVHAAGALVIAADDVGAKSLAARLHVLGFVSIDEIGEGTHAPRRLRASETIEAAAGHPWRLTPNREGVLAAFSPARI